MSRITTHVLDTALGRPAAGVCVELQCEAASNAWTALARASTDAQGRVADFGAGPLRAANYRLRFDTGAYFAQTGRAAFFPTVEICFRVDAPTEHHHVPLLLSPFGYSTYRGS